MDKLDKALEVLQQVQPTLSPSLQLALVACFKSTLTMEETAAFTGLSMSHLYKLTSTNRIPHYKPMGKYIYFDRGELEAWMKRNRVKTVEEVEHGANIYLAKNRNR